MNCAALNVFGAPGIERHRDRCNIAVMIAVVIAVMIAADDRCLDRR
jgi:hypothetical protein